MLGFLFRIDLFLGGVIVGLVVTVVAQLYVVKMYLLKPFPIPPEQVSSEGDIDAPIDLPPELAAKLSDSDSPGTDRFPAGQKALPVPENSLFMNMLMLHGFLALRDTRKMRERFEAWMETKIMDLKKVIGSVSLVEYDLGHSTPFLTNCQVTESVVANDFNRTTVYCDLRYTGALSFTLHVDLPFGYEGTVRIEVTEISGAARIQVRSPDVTSERLTERDANWSISFLKDPRLQFTCTSSFKGSHIARITSLIEYQLKRSILRKHTLPNYWPRYILKDRLQIVPVQGPWIKEKKSIIPSALTSLGSSGSVSMGTMAIHVDRCMNLGSIARRDILFRRRLYIVVMYSDGATKHRSPAVVVTDDTAIFDFNVEFSLFPEHRALDIEIFEKRRVSKDSRVATGQINLTRVYGQCCKRKDGEPFELSAPLVLDGAVITRTDTTEMNRSSYQEKTNKPTPPIPLSPLQAASRYSVGNSTSLNSLQNEWLHNTSLPNEMARMNLSANRNRSLDVQMSDAQSTGEIRRSVPNAGSVESDLDEMDAADTNSISNPSVRWRRLRSGVTVPSRNSTDSNSGTSNGVNVSKVVNSVSSGVNSVNGVSWDSSARNTPHSEPGDSDSDLSPRAQPRSAPITNAAVIIEPVLVLRFTLRKDDTSAVYQPSQPIPQKNIEPKSNKGSLKQRLRSHSESRKAAAGTAKSPKSINKSPQAINRSPQAINRSPEAINIPSSTDQRLQSRGRTASGPQLAGRRLAFTDDMKYKTQTQTQTHTVHTPTHRLDTPHTRTHTLMATHAKALGSSRRSTQSEHSASGSEDEREYLSAQTHTDTHRHTQTPTDTHARTRTRARAYKDSRAPGRLGRGLGLQDGNGRSDADVDTDTDTRCHGNGGGRDGASSLTGTQRSSRQGGAFSGEGVDTHTDTVSTVCGYSDQETVGRGVDRTKGVDSTRGGCSERICRHGCDDEGPDQHRNAAGIMHQGTGQTLNPTTLEILETLETLEPVCRYKGPHASGAADTARTIDTRRSGGRDGGGCHDNASILTDPDDDYVHVGAADVSDIHNIRTDTPAALTRSRESVDGHARLIRAHFVERIETKRPHGKANDHKSNGAWELCAVCCGIATDKYIYTCIVCHMQFHASAECIDSARAVVCAGPPTTNDLRFIEQRNRVNVFDSDDSEGEQKSEISDTPITGQPSTSNKKVDTLPSARSLSELLGTVKPPKLIIDPGINTAMNTGTDSDALSATASDIQIDSPHGLRSLVKSIYHTLQCAFAMRQRLSDLQNKMGRLQRTHINELLLQCEVGSQDNSTTLMASKGSKNVPNGRKNVKKGSKPVHKGDWQQYLQDIWNILERGEQEKITIDESIAFVNTQIGKMANEILDLCTVLGAHEAINHPQTEELSST